VVNATYSVIFVLGVAGNIVVVYVVATNSTMQTITNVCCRNLVFNDATRDTNLSFSVALKSVKNGFDEIA